MANPNNPFGFMVLKSDGKENRVSYHKKASGNAIYPGDTVKLLAAGTVDVAAAGDLMLGVAAEYKAATNTDSMAIFDDPDAEFLVQVSADFQAADVGQNANIVANAGDATLKQSNQTIDSSSFGTESVKQFKLLGLASKGENAVGSYAMIKVKPNHHVFKAGVSGV